MEALTQRDTVPLAEMVNMMISFYPLYTVATTFKLPALRSHTTIDSRTQTQDDSGSNYVSPKNSKSILCPRQNIYKTHTKM